MNSFKNNKVLYILLIIAVVTFLFVGVGRIRIESNNKKADIVLDYAELEKMVSQSEHDIYWWLIEFKKMGVNYVAVGDESLNTLVESNKPVKVEIMDKVLKDIYWKNKYPEEVVELYNNNEIDKYDVIVTINSKQVTDFIKSGLLRYDENKYKIIEKQSEDYLILDGNVKDSLYTKEVKYIDSTGDGFLNKVNLVSSKLLSLSLGLDSKKVEIVESMGLNVIPRTYSYENWNDEKFAENVVNEYKALKSVPPYLIFAGAEVVGANDNIDIINNYINENNIKIGLIETTVQRENIEQAGILELVENQNYNAVRVFSVWPYIQNRYQYYNYPGAEEIENTLYRAITERNIRVVYFKPFKELNDSYIYITDIKEYEKMFEGLKNRLLAHNITLGEATVMKPYKVPLFSKVLMGFGAVAAAILFISYIFNLKKIMKYVLLLLGIIGVIGAFAVSRDLSSKLLAFGAATVFPSLSMLYFMRSCKGYKNSRNKNEKLHKIILLGIKGLIVSSLISFIGAMFVASVLADSKYLLEIDIFRGVKISQLLPILLFVVVYFACFGYDREDKETCYIRFNDIKSFLVDNIKIGLVIIGGVVLVAGYIYLARTGHETNVQPSDIEMIARNFFEEKLLARPRTKEFLVAFPAFILCIVAFIRRYKLLPFIFGLAAVIGQTSIVNTFSHLRTPIYLSCTRTIYSIVIGIILGVIYVIILEGLIKLYNKLRGAI